jgi:hypothetical protein
MYNSRNNLIIGFHGCDEKVQNALLNYPNKIKVSDKPYDWLGHGIYFWENNFDRALQWAKDKEKKGEINKASVIGAVISLDYCLDLTDTNFINLLTSYFDLMQDEYKQIGKELPKNKNIFQDKNNDLLLRDLDCAVIEFMHQKVEEEIEKDIKIKGHTDYKIFDSARGLFTEGGPAFPGAGIQKKNHLQICIRNSNCIKGFFLPRKEIKFH